ncbi:TetR/AcrR family transcriptional regulator [Niallia sp. Krafla_26]|uniref:TetR/AcrR family transcriptional regulator n=1 Tax=Niallia sp. Krafla_26 TaxID=3064703 RepID=UPI003D167E68
MPKQTFFNLPEEKRQHLIDVAQKEFSQVPLMKASVANIIKMAGIPRGSFYQYFENLEDLYNYLLDQETQKRKEDFISLLMKHNGDIIETVTVMYHHFLIELPDEEEHTFLKNAILNVSNKDGFSFTDMFDLGKGKDHVKEIIHLIDRDRLNIQEDAELFHILQIITAVVFRNFIEKLLKELSDQEAIDNFTIEMNILKRGIYIDA